MAQTQPPLHHHFASWSSVGSFDEAPSEEASSSEFAYEDARAAAELEEARVRQLEEEKQRRLEEFRQKEAARVRVYRQLELRHRTRLASRLTPRGVRQSAPEAAAIERPEASAPSQESLAARRLQCRLASAAARRSLVRNVEQREPDARQPDAEAAVEVVPADSELTVTPAESAEGDHEQQLRARAAQLRVRFAPTADDLLSTRHEVATRQRATQRSLSALSEREAARRWQRRRCSAAKGKRLKLLAEQRRRNEEASLRQEVGEEAEDDDDDDDDSVVSVTELTHTALTLTDQSAPAERPEPEPAPANQLAFLLSLDGDDRSESAASSLEETPLTEEAKQLADRQRLRQRLRRRCQELKLTIPGLCACSPDPWTADVRDCAVNCMFSNNEQLLLDTIAGLVQSVDANFTAD